MNKLIAAAFLFSTFAGTGVANDDRAQKIAGRGPDAHVFAASRAATLAAWRRLASASMSMVSSGTYTASMSLCSGRRLNPGRNANRFKRSAEGQSDRLLVGDARAPGRDGGLDSQGHAAARQPLPAAR